VPQLEVVPTLDSQPLLTLPSQLPKPGMHCTEQTPPAQLGESLLVLQALPQVPQLLTSVPVAVSQLVPVALQWV